MSPIHPNQRFARFARIEFPPESTELTCCPDWLRLEAFSSPNPRFKIIVPLLPNHWLPELYRIVDFYKFLPNQGSEISQDLSPNRSPSGAHPNYNLSLLPELVSLNHTELNSSGKVRRSLVISFLSEALCSRGGCCSRPYCLISPILMRIIL